MNHNFWKLLKSSLTYKKNIKNLIWNLDKKSYLLCITNMVLWCCDVSNVYVAFVELYKDAHRSEKTDGLQKALEQRLLFVRKWPKTIIERETKLLIDSVNNFHDMLMATIVDRTRILSDSILASIASNMSSISSVAFKPKPIPL